MTKNMREIVEIDIPAVELLSPTEAPLEYFTSAKVGLRIGEYAHYTLAQSLELGQNINQAYRKAYTKYSAGTMPGDLDPLLGIMLNEYITMWVQVSDLKQKKGYVASTYDNEPETKKEGK